MGKDFLRLKTDQRSLCAILLAGGIVITVILGIRAYRDTELLNGYELQKNDVTEGAYEQNVVAYVGEQKVPLTITVEERKLSKEEAEEEFLKAEKLLPDILKAQNENLSEVTTGLNFVNQIPETGVEVEWIEKAADYFYSDGEFREELEISEPIELKISAILVCQEYTKDYETTIAILPRVKGIEEKLLKLIEEENEEDFKSEIMTLPKEYEGQSVVWRKSLDYTFLYFLALTVGAVLFVKIGGKRDEEEAQKERLEALEKDYAQIVSKFAMLLSAGLSVRNAWERIVLMYRRWEPRENVLYQELSWGLRQMQKGVLEMEVYEQFGIRVGQVHYKKLMALFISDKRRGSINLLEAMNQEMLQAWDEQKRKTRQQGEKIGTKLLIPMMGMLGVVFIMVLVPAFLSFQL